MLKNKWFIGLVLLVAALLVYAKMKGKDKKEGIKVATEVAAKRTLVETVTANGKIYPETEIKISPDISGEIVELYVKEGDSIKAGQLLAKIKPDSYQSILERAEAATNSAKSQEAAARSQISQLQAQKVQVQAQIENAEKIYARNQKLFKEGILSEVELDASETSVRQLKANITAIEANISAASDQAEAAGYSVKSAQASVKEAKTSLNQTLLYAPINGIITALNFKKGEKVVGTLQMSGSEIMRIANLNYMEVQVDVSENDVLRISTGDTADIEVDAYLDRKFKGVVTQIANSAKSSVLATATSNSATDFVVKIRLLENSYKDLLGQKGRYPFRPGMSANVDIRTETLRDVLTVPIRAVSTRVLDKNKDKEELVEVVFLYKGDTVAQQQVKTGIQDDAYIHIVSGLNEGDELVSDPYNAVARRLKAGAKVIKTPKDKLYEGADTEEKK